MKIFICNVFKHIVIDIYKHMISLNKKISKFPFGHNSQWVYDVLLKFVSWNITEPRLWYSAISYRRNRDAYSCFHICRFACTQAYAEGLLCTMVCHKVCNTPHSYISFMQRITFSKISFPFQNTSWFSVVTIGFLHLCSPLSI
jgi:hypothetical protein